MTPRSLATVATATALMLATGCASGDPPDQTQPSATVKYVTGFGIRAQEAYMYVALEKGYFRDAGLDVEIVAGKGTGYNMTLLLSGKADFAMLDVAGALIEYAGPNRTHGFTIVAAVHQRTTSCLMALASSGISRPRDLAGKRIGYQPGGVNYTMFPTYAMLGELAQTARFEDPAIKSIEWVQVPAGQEPQVLAAGQVDAVTQLVVGRPYVEAAAEKARGKNDKAVVTLAYSDYLTDLYGNSLGVTTKTAEQKPDLVRRFRDAMLNGLAYMYDHPDEAGQIFAKRAGIKYDRKIAAKEVELLKPYVKPINGEPWGSLTDWRVARTVAILQGAGAIPGPVAPEEIVNFGLVPSA